jgi:hypothetical protein
LHRRGVEPLDRSSQLLSHGETRDQEDLALAVDHRVRGPRDYQLRGALQTLFSGVVVVDHP